MKHILYITCFITFIIHGCNYNEYTEFENNIQSDNQYTISEKRDYQEAKNIAIQAISLFDDNVQTRSNIASSKRTLKKTDNTKYIINKKTRAGTSYIDTLMYIFNYDDNRGFAIISANRNTDAIIAVVDSGQFNSEFDIEKTGYSLYMNLAKDYVENAKKSSSKSYSTYSQQWHKFVTDTIDHIYIAPKIKLKWGQSYIEGLFCPNGISGCSNTAVAMAMAYFRFPNTIPLTYPEADKPSISLDWDKINGHISRYVVDNCDTYTHNAIGCLCRQIGYLSGSTYNNGSTGTSIKKTKSTMEQLGYIIGYGATPSPNFITSALNKNMLFLMAGFTDNNEGHMWIVDGCEYFYIRKYFATSNDNIFWKIIEEHYTTTLYNHINWGWDGSWNGYFNNNVFNTNDYISLDDYIQFGNNPELNFENNIQYLTVYHE